MNHRSLDYPDPVQKPEPDELWWVKAILFACSVAAITIFLLGVGALVQKLADIGHAKAERDARARTSNEVFHLFIGLPAWDPTNNIIMTNMTGFTVTNLTIPHWEFRITPISPDIEVDARRRRPDLL